MTRHLLRLVWNRKRTTLLLMAEIAVAFLVLLAVTGVAVYAMDNWRRPVGFAWEHVWDIEVDRPEAIDADEQVEIVREAADAAGPAQPPLPAPTPEPASARTSEQETFAQLLTGLRALPEVEMATASGVAPFEFGGMVESREVNGRRLEFGANEVLDGYADLLGLQLARGRWPGPEDAGQAYDAVVINEDMRRVWFGDRDPVGQPIVELDAEDLARGARPTRIVGVMQAYREDGEFDGQRNCAIYRKTLEGAGRRNRPPRHILIRVRPGTPASFEPQLLERLHAGAPQWSFEVRTLAAMRDSQLRFTLVPLAAVGAVAGSLLLMVGLGLLGVMWQVVTQRTREMGLRRAKGATRDAIGRQVLAEILLMVTLAVVPATLLAAQVPLFGVFYWVQPHVYLAALALSLAAIYVLAVICGWYPARLATAIEPADALRYE
jgi:putative ABC transport system permease protein